MFLRVKLTPIQRLIFWPDVVVMEPETARMLRQTLQHLVRDCDRRQELVQELIITNNSLRYSQPLTTQRKKFLQLRAIVTPLIMKKKFLGILLVYQNRQKTTGNEKHVRAAIDQNGDAVLCSLSGLGTSELCVTGMNCWNKLKYPDVMKPERRISKRFLKVPMTSCR